jgi:copper(I)-binding protein
VSRTSRRAVAVIGVLAIAPVVSGCGAGMHPQTTLSSQLVEGVNASAGEVDLRNLFVLGPLPGQRLTAHGDAPVYMAIVNSGSSPDRLVAVDAPGLAGAAQIANGAINLPPTTLVTTNQPVTRTPTPTPSSPSATASPIPAPTAAKKPTPASSQKPTLASSKKRTPAPAAGTTITEPSTLILRDLARDLTGGETVRLVFHFERAGTLSVNVPVEPMQGYYTTYSPVPTVTPTPTPPPTPAKAHRSGKPKATPTT